jgi:hypothetical protein
VTVGPQIFLRASAAASHRGHGSGLTASRLRKASCWRTSRPMIWPSVDATYPIDRPPLRGHLIPGDDGLFLRDEVITPASRRFTVKRAIDRAMTPRRAYRSDLSDARWALIEPVLSAWRAARTDAGLGLSKPAHDLREIANAILYVTAPASHGSTCRTISRHARQSSTTTPNGRKTAPPGRSTTCCAARSASRPAAPPSRPPRSSTPRSSRHPRTHPKPARGTTQARKPKDASGISPPTPSGCCSPWLSPPPRSRTPTAASRSPSS